MVHFPLYFSRMLSGAFALSLAAAPAFARENLSPPPSGVVIHLFGPNSVTSNILPGAPTSGGSAAGGTASGAGGTAASNSEYDPSWSEIAHQMFVTGDPSQEGAAALPKGKAGGN